MSKSLKVILLLIIVIPTLNTQKFQYQIYLKTFKFNL
jgi:hypothetical protein